MNEETNLIDLCLLFFKFVKDLIIKLFRLFKNMVFISIRRWYLVCPMLVICVGYVLHKVHTYNITYRIEGVVRLFGPTKEESVIKFNQLKNAHFAQTNDLSQLLSLEKPLAKKIGNFTCYDIIDCLNDGTPDYVDYDGKTPTNDTLYVHMQDRFCFRFTLNGNLEKLPLIENAILTYFNTDPVFIHKHKFYIENLTKEKEFYEEQAENALTKYIKQTANPMSKERTEYKLDDQKLVVDNSKFDKMIDEAFNWTRISSVDTKLNEGSQPVVLLNHLTFEPATRHMLIRYTLLGWILGCLIAWTFENRKRLYEEYKNSRK